MAVRKPLYIASNGRLTEFVSGTDTLEGAGTSATKATATFTPANPTATATTSAVMVGLGATCVLTPLATGKVFVIMTYVFAPGSTSPNVTFQGRYGTGSAPANGAAATGTTAGASVNLISGGSTAKTMATISYMLTSLTVNTQYWFDISVTASSATNTITLTSFNVQIIEL